MNTSDKNYDDFNNAEVLYRYQQGVHETHDLKIKKEPSLSGGYSFTLVPKAEYSKTFEGFAKSIFHSIHDFFSYKTQAETKKILQTITSKVKIPTLRNIDESTQITTSTLKNQMEMRQMKMRTQDPRATLTLLENVNRTYQKNLK